MKVDKAGKIEDFAIFVLSHRRADKVYTWNMLKKYGNKQDVYIVIDDSDDEADKYVKRFGRNKIIIFNKDTMRGTFDMMDNDTANTGVVFARNKVYDIAEQLQLKYFLVLDDDYSKLEFKMDNYGRYHAAGKVVKDLNTIIIKLVEVYEKMPDYVVTIAIAQTGDFIGGRAGGLARTFAIKRKAMNWFICSPKRRVEFIGRLNEDVNTYVADGMKGKVFLSIPYVSLRQRLTQQNTGGLTEMYLDMGTYRKSFYSVICNPSSVKIIKMGTIYPRIHHFVQWRYAVPKILRDG